jgi:nucleotide-binding universal stress UspA family protein
MRVQQARELTSAALEKLAARAQAAHVAYHLVGTEEHPEQELLVAAQRYDVILISQWPQLEKNNEPDPLLTQLLQHSPRPVIAVPKQLPSGDAVVIAYDGSLQATRTLQMFALLWKPASRVHIVCVQAKVEDAQRHAETAREFLKWHSIEATVHAVAGPSPHKVLQDAVKQHQAGLMVMGAYGKPSWREFFFGTVTKHLLTESEVPLFLYH